MRSGGWTFAIITGSMGSAIGGLMALAIWGLIPETGYYQTVSGRSGTYETAWYYDRTYPTSGFFDVTYGQGFADGTYPTGGRYDGTYGTGHADGTYNVRRKIDR